MLDISNINVTNDISCNGKLNVVGESNFNAKVCINDILDISNTLVIPRKNTLPEVGELGEIFYNTNNDTSGKNSDLEFNNSRNSKKIENFSSSKDTAKKELFDEKESYNSDDDSNYEKKSYHGLKKELEDSL